MTIRKGERSVAGTLHTNRQREWSKDVWLFYLLIQVRADRNNLSADDDRVLLAYDSVCALSSSARDQGLDTRIETKRSIGVAQRIIRPPERLIS